MNTEWISKTALAAEVARHIFPVMAACEAALESSYGESELAKAGNNLFGTKQHAHQTFGTITLPTKEFERGEWVVIDAEFVKYSSLQDCFYDRMNTLKRLAPHYPHYQAALDAKDEVAYIEEVSQTWSTDPERASKVLTIFKEYETTKAYEQAAKDLPGPVEPAPAEQAGSAPPTPEGESVPPADLSTQGDV